MDAEDLAFVARARRALSVQHAMSPAFQMMHSRALQTVRDALKLSKRPYVAFSGGKDSMATLALVHSIDPEVPFAWSDDELEYPETVELMTALKQLAGDQMIVSEGWAEHAGWFRPWRDRPFWRDPLPGTLHAGMDSDDWMRTRGHDLVFTGLRKDESRVRADWLNAAGPIYRVKGGTGRRCCPIADWSVDDVWALIAIMGLPVNGVYDRLELIGEDRQGQRVGPLPLTPRAILQDGWPDLLEKLEARYGERWR